MAASILTFFQKVPYPMDEQILLHQVPLLSIIKDSLKLKRFIRKFSIILRDGFWVSQSWKLRILINLKETTTVESNDNMLVYQQCGPSLIPILINNIALSLYPRDLLSQQKVECTPLQKVECTAD